MEEKTSLDEFCPIVQSLFELYEVLKCCICLEVLQSPITLKCKHTFCNDCLKSSQTNNCPLCRKISNRREKLPNEAAEKLSTFIKNIAEQIHSSTKVDVFSDANAMKIIKRHNKKMSKKTIMPSTSKPCTILQKPIPKNPSNKSQEPENVFDVLLESSRSQGRVKKPLRTYNNKRKQKTTENIEVTDKIQQFQNEEQKENVVKWLMDSQNEFERITQTQQGPIKGNYVDATLSSVSQDFRKDGLLYYHEVNEVKRRRAELRRYGSFSKRCRSLDIQIIKPVRGRLNRQSISCDSPDFEDNGAVEVDAQETTQEVVKKVKLVQQIEEECLRTLEGNVNKPEGNAGKVVDYGSGSSPIPASAWDRMKKLNEKIRKSERQPKQLKIYRASSLKKNGKLNVGSDKIDDSFLNYRDVENPTTNLKNQVSINHLINFNDAQKFSKTNSVIDEIESNDNAIVNLNEIESFFKKYGYQQNDSDSEYSLYFPEKKEKRKAEKRDVILEKQLNIEVEVFSKNSEEGKGIGSSCKRKDLEELETSNNTLVDQISKDLKQSTGKISSPEVSSKKSARLLDEPKKSNVDEEVQASVNKCNDETVTPKKKKACFKNKLKACNHNQVTNLRQKMNLVVVLPDINKTVEHVLPKLRPKSSRKKMSSPSTPMKENRTELESISVEPFSAIDVPNDSSAENKQTGHADMMKNCQDIQSSLKPLQEQVEHVPDIAGSRQNISRTEQKSNSSQIENIETEQLVKQISTSFDELLRKKRKIDTFGLLQKEFENKLSTVENDAQEMNENSITHNVEDGGKNQDTTSKVIGITQNCEEKTVSKVVEKREETTEEFTDNKENGNNNQDTDLCESIEEMIFSMPTQKMQTEEVCTIQKSIQKIQDILKNSSFSSGVSDFQSVREQINNVQLYLDDLENKRNEENIQIDGDEQNLMIVQSGDLMNDIISKDSTELLKNYQEILKTILGILNNNEDVLKDIDEHLRDGLTDATLLENYRKIHMNYEKILSKTKDTLMNIEESFTKQLNNINSSYYKEILRDCRQLLKNNQTILQSTIDILWNIQENDELLLLFDKLLKNNIETLKNIKETLDEEIIKTPINQIYMKNRILGEAEENVKLEKGTRVHASVQITPPQLISKSIQTDTEDKPLMKNTAVQHELKSTDQEVQTLVVQNKEIAIQSIVELTDISIQTDFEDKGFHISSNEAFKTLVVTDAAVQTTDQNVKTVTDHIHLTLSPSFDNLQFETQDAINDFNKEDSEKSVSQILNGLQQSGTSKAILKGASASSQPKHKNSANILKSTSQMSHWKLVRNKSSTKFIETDGQNNLRIISSSNKISKSLNPEQLSSEQVQNKYCPTNKKFTRQNQTFDYRDMSHNSKENSIFKKSFDPNRNTSLSMKNIIKDVPNKSLKFSNSNVKKDVPQKSLSSRNSLNFNKCSSTSKEIRVKSVIPLDIEVIPSNKPSSGESNLLISLEKHSSVPHKEKYKRIRTPSSDSDSNDEGCKRFKKMDNRFIRDDISVVFDSETQNKNLEDVSSFGSSGINMDYIDQIWDKIDNGVFGNVSKQADNHKITEARPSKKFKSGASKMGTQELLEKCDQHINNLHKKSSSQQTKIKFQNECSKYTTKSEVTTSNAGTSKKSPEKLLNVLEESVNTDNYNKSTKLTEKPPRERTISPQEINSNPCSVEKLIDDALQDDFNKPFISNNKESEDLFVSCLEFRENNALQIESEADKAMADFIASTMDDKDMELFKPDSEIAILQNIVLRNPVTADDDITIIQDSEEEIFENEPDVIENTPEKPPPIKMPRLAFNSRTELFPSTIEEEESVEVTIPPPLEFQDFFQDNEDDLLAQINADEMKENIPVNHNKSLVLPITQNFTGSTLLSLSPITKEFSNKSLHLNPLQLSMSKNTSSNKNTSSTPKSQKQISIKSFMCKSKKPRQAAAELFGLNEKLRKPCIACSRLNKDQVIAISALTNKKLATYSTVFNSTVTHMIVNTNGSNCVKDHTIKYVTAVAAGIWVLSFRWIQDSLAKNVLLPEEPYEVLDVSGIPGPREARLFCKTKRLLKGFKIYAAPPFISTTQADLEYIIVTLGGKTVSKPDELLPEDGDLCLIITETRPTQDFGQYETWLEALGVVTVDIEWLSHSVGQFKLISLRRFVLCSDDTITNLGYPSELTAILPFSCSQSTTN